METTMAARILFVLTCLVPLAATHGADAAPQGGASPAAIQAAIARQEAVISNLDAQMLVLDTGIEARVNLLVTQLAALKDSPDSGTKVVRTKREVIDMLRNSITFYRTERAKKITDSRSSASRQTTGDIARTVGNLDSRIEQRVDQVVTLSSSLMQNQDLASYETARDGGYVKSGHVRDVGAKTEEVKRDVKSAFDDALDRLEREVTMLENKLKTATTPAERQTIEAWLQNDRALLARRRAQRERALGTSSGTAAQVTAKAAQTIDDKIEDGTTDIREDYRVMMRLYYDRDRARAELNRLAKELARAKAADPPR